MDKAILVPIRFRCTEESTFNEMFSLVKKQYEHLAEFTSPCVLGEAIPDCDGILIPVMDKDVYKHYDQLKAIGKPVLVITTPFGVSLMFDWESVNSLKEKGVQVYHPHSVELAESLMKGLALKRSMKKGKFLMFHDSEGEGLIDEEFKIFYWWNDECQKSMHDRFGVNIVHKSFKKLGADAKNIPDAEAQAELDKRKFPASVSRPQALLASMKLYMQICKEIDAEGDVIGCGVNCLNEAFYTDTTPCMAWHLLQQERDISFICEGDTASLMMKFLAEKTIKDSVFLTNIYPFLSGKPALDHEKLDAFPEVDSPNDHALIAHCGYLGCLPQKMCTKWMLRDCALGWLVGENSTAVDAEIGTGPITICKFSNNFDRMMVVRAELEKYIGYPGTDFRNGGLVRVPDGERFMDKNYSHHIIVVKGKRYLQLKAVASLFGVETEEV